MALIPWGGRIGWALVVAGLVRAALMVAHVPLAGFANQYDMVRTSDCVGWYPDLARDARFQASPAAPIPAYVRDSRAGAQCYPASEAAIVAVAGRLAAVVSGDASRMPLRAVGWLQWGMLAAAAVALTWALGAAPLAAIVHGIVFLLVMADPAVTLWMNTLYTEFPALWALYVCVAGLVALGLAPARRRAATAAWVAAALIVLAFSREQFALLPPLLVACGAPWLWSRSRRIVAGLLGVAVVAAAISFALVPRAPVVHEVNRADTYLGLLLPASAQPAHALAVLGLPARCERVVGATWYLPRGENLRDACPEALALPSTAFARLALEEPATLLRAFARAVPTLEPALPPYLGVLAGARFARVQDLPPWLRSVMDFDLPLPLFVALLVAMVLLLPVAAYAALSRRWRTRPAVAAGATYAVLLALVVAYAFATTVLGDGLSESARHFLPGTVASSAAVASALAGVALALLRSATTARLAAAAAAFLAVTVAVTAGSIAWAARQPLALGVVDQPASRQVRGNLALRGWALDPFGVQSVSVVLGGVRMDARYGREATAALASFYPAYPDAGRGGFALDVPVEQLQAAAREGRVELRVLVKSRAGPVTEIDRRVLEIAR